MVSDLPRIGEWSPECERVDWEGDVTVPVVGHHLRRTQRGRARAAHPLLAPRRVLVADPGREFAFITDEGGRESTVWRYQFEPLGDGRTRVTEGYEVRWIPTWARILDVPTEPPQGAAQGHAHHPRAPQGGGRGRAPRRRLHHRDPRAGPVMTTCFTATPGVDVITTTADIPALGSLAINAFVLHGTEPILVDTGTVAGAAEFMTALTSVIDPGRAALDLAHPHRLRSHRLAGHAARAESRPAGHHVVPRRRHHGPVVDAAADGPRPPRQPRPVA